MNTEDKDSFKKKKDDIRYLLKEINIVRGKYLLLDDAKEKFNIFSTLHKKRDERRLHSRFISSILDPKGYHGLGSRPLEMFLETINSGMKISDSIVVSPNCTDWSEKDRNDIRICDRSCMSAVLIENKIDAPDSNHPEPPEPHGQLEGYYWNLLKDKFDRDKIEVYYLTPDRRKPSDESVSLNGKTPELQEKVQCIDYPHEIVSWLNKVVSVTYDKPYLRETILQYIDLINKMTGELEVPERIDLLTLVGKNDDNLLSARLLLKNFPHLCWHALADFNNEMLASLREKSYEIIIKPNENDISTIIHGGPVQKKKVDFTYVINDKQGICWTLEETADDDSGFYIGIKKDRNKALSKDVKKAIEESAKDKDSNDRWYYRKYITDLNGPALFFWDFLATDRNTFDILSPSKRRDIISDITRLVMEEIKELDSLIRR